MRRYVSLHVKKVLHGTITDKSLSLILPTVHEGIITASICAYKEAGHEKENADCSPEFTYTPITKVCTYDSVPVAYGLTPIINSCIAPRTVPLLSPYCLFPDATNNDGTTDQNEQFSESLSSGQSFCYDGCPLLSAPFASDVTSSFDWHHDSVRFHQLSLESQSQFRFIYDHPGLNMATALGTDPNFPTTSLTFAGRLLTTMGHFTETEFLMWNLLRFQETPANSALAPPLPPFTLPINTVAVVSDEAMFSSAPAERFTVAFGSLRCGFLSKNAGFNPGAQWAGHVSSYDLKKLAYNSPKENNVCVISGVTEASKFGRRIVPGFGIAFIPTFLSTSLYSRATFGVAEKIMMKPGIGQYACIEGYVPARDVNPLETTFMCHVSLTEGQKPFISDQGFRCVPNLPVCTLQDLLVLPLLNNEKLETEDLSTFHERIYYEGDYLDFLDTNNRVKPSYDTALETKPPPRCRVDAYGTPYWYLAPLTRTSRVGLLGYERDVDVSRCSPTSTSVVFLETSTYRSSFISLPCNSALPSVVYSSQGLPSKILVDTSLSCGNLVLPRMIESTDVEIDLTYSDGDGSVTSITATISKCPENMEYNSALYDSGSLSGPLILSCQSESWEWLARTTGPNVRYNPSVLPLCVPITDSIDSVRELHVTAPPFLPCVSHLLNCVIMSMYSTMNVVSLFSEESTKTRVYLVQYSSQRLSIHPRTFQAVETFSLVGTTNPVDNSVIIQASSGPLAKTLYNNFNTYFLDLVDGIFENSYRILLGEVTIRRGQSFCPPESLQSLGTPLDIRTMYTEQRYSYYSTVMSSTLSPYGLPKDGLLIIQAKTSDSAAITAAQIGLDSGTSFSKNTIIPAKEIYARCFSDGTLGYHPSRTPYFVMKGKASPTIPSESCSYDSNAGTVVRIDVPNHSYQHLGFIATQNGMIDESASYGFFQMIAAPFSTIGYGEIIPIHLTSCLLSRVKPENLGSVVSFFDANDGGRILPLSPDTALGESHVGLRCTSRGWRYHLPNTERASLSPLVIRQLLDFGSPLNRYLYEARQATLQGDELGRQVSFSGIDSTSIFLHQPHFSDMMRCFSSKKIFAHASKAVLWSLTATDLANIPISFEDLSSQASSVGQKILGFDPSLDRSSAYAIRPFPVLGAPFTIARDLSPQSSQLFVVDMLETCPDIHPRSPLCENATTSAQYLFLPPRVLPYWVHVGDTAPVDDQTRPSFRTKDIYHSFVHWDDMYVQNISDNMCFLSSIQETAVGYPSQYPISKVLPVRTPNEVAEMVLPYQCAHHRFYFENTSTVPTYYCSEGSVKKIQDGSNHKCESNTDITFAHTSLYTNSEKKRRFVATFTSLNHDDLVLFLPLHTYPMVATQEVRFVFLFPFMVETKQSGVVVMDIASGTSGVLTKLGHPVVLSKDLPRLVLNFKPVSTCRSYLPYDNTFSSQQPRTGYVYIPTEVAHGEKIQSLFTLDSIPLHCNTEHFLINAVNPAMISVNSVRRDISQERCDASANPLLLVCVPSPYLIGATQTTGMCIRAMSLTSDFRLTAKMKMHNFVLKSDGDNIGQIFENMLPYYKTSVFNQLQFYGAANEGQALQLLSTIRDRRHVILTISTSQIILYANFDQMVQIVDTPFEYYRKNTGLAEIIHALNYIHDQTLAPESAPSPEVEYQIGFEFTEDLTPFSFNLSGSANIFPNGREIEAIIQELRENADYKKQVIAAPSQIQNPNFLRQYAEINLGSVITGAHLGENWSILLSDSTPAWKTCQVGFCLDVGSNEISQIDTAKIALVPPTGFCAKHPLFAPYQSSGAYTPTKLCQGLSIATEVDSGSASDPNCKVQAPILDPAVVNSAGSSHLLVPLIDATQRKLSKCMGNTALDKTFHFELKCIYRGNVHVFPFSNLQMTYTADNGGGDGDGDELDPLPADPIPPGPVMLQISTRPRSSVDVEALPLTSFSKYFLSKSVPLRVCLSCYDQAEVLRTTALHYSFSYYKSSIVGTYRDRFLRAQDPTRIFRWVNHDILCVKNTIESKPSGITNVFDSGLDDEGFEILHLNPTVLDIMVEEQYSSCRLFATLELETVAGTDENGAPIPSQTISTSATVEITNTGFGISSFLAVGIDGSVAMAMTENSLIEQQIASVPPVGHFSAGLPRSTETISNSGANALFNMIVKATEIFPRAPILSSPQPSTALVFMVAQSSGVSFVVSTFQPSYLRVNSLFVATRFRSVSDTAYFHRLYHSPVISHGPHPDPSLSSTHVQWTVRYNRKSQSEIDDSFTRSLQAFFSLHFDFALVDVGEVITDQTPRHILTQAVVGLFVPAPYPQVQPVTSMASYLTLDLEPSSPTRGQAVVSFTPIDLTSSKGFSEYFVTSHAAISQTQSPSFIAVSLRTSLGHAFITRIAAGTAASFTTEACALTRKESIDVYLFLTNAAGMTSSKIFSFTISDFPLAMLRSLEETCGVQQADVRSDLPYHRVAETQQQILAYLDPQNPNLSLSLCTQSTATEPTEGKFEIWSVGKDLQNTMQLLISSTIAIEAMITHSRLEIEIAVYGNPDTIGSIAFQRIAHALRATKASLAQLQMVECAMSALAYQEFTVPWEWALDISPARQISSAFVFLRGWLATKGRYMAVPDHSSNALSFLTSLDTLSATLGVNDAAPTSVLSNAMSVIDVTIQSLGSASRSTTADIQIVKKDHILLSSALRQMANHGEDEEAESKAALNLSTVLFALSLSSYTSFGQKRDRAEFSVSKSPQEILSLALNAVEDRMDRLTRESDKLIQESREALLLTTSILSSISKMAFLGTSSARLYTDSETGDANTDQDDIMSRVLFRTSKTTQHSHISLTQIPRGFGKDTKMAPITDGERATTSVQLPTNVLARMSESTQKNLVTAFLSVKDMDFAQAVRGENRRVDEETNHDEVTKETLPSAVVSLSILDGDSGEPIPVKQVVDYSSINGLYDVVNAHEPEWFFIEIPIDNIDPSMVYGNSGSVCLYSEGLSLDPTTPWRSDASCVIHDLTSTSVVCRCTHLTFFSVRLSAQSFIPRFQAITIKELRLVSWDNFSRNAAPLGILIGWPCLTILLLLLGSYVDRRLYHQGIAKLVNDWNPRDQKPYGKAEVYRVASSNSLLYIIWRRFTYTIRDTHIWFSIFMRQTTHNYSSQSRAFTAMTILLSSFTLSGLFSGYTDQGAITVIIMTSVCLFFISEFMRMIYDRTEKDKLKRFIYYYAESLVYFYYTGKSSLFPVVNHESIMQKRPEILIENGGAQLGDIVLSMGWEAVPMGAVHAHPNRDVPRQEKQTKFDKNIVRQYALGDVDHFFYRARDHEYRLSEEEAKQIHRVVRLKLPMDSLCIDDIAKTFNERSVFELVPSNLRLAGLGLILIWIAACYFLVIVVTVGLSTNGNNSFSGSSISDWVVSAAISVLIDVFFTSFVLCFVKSCLFYGLNYISNACCCHGKSGQKTVLVDTDSRINALPPIKTFRRLSFMTAEEDIEMVAVDCKILKNDGSNQTTSGAARVWEVANRPDEDEEGSDSHDSLGDNSNQFVFSATVNRQPPSAFMPDDLTKKI